LANLRVYLERQKQVYSFFFEKLQVMANIHKAPGSFKTIQFKGALFVTNISFFNDERYVLPHSQASYLLKLPKDDSNNK